MCEVAVIPARYPEHPEHVKKSAYDPVEQGGAGKKGAQGQQVNNKESDFLFKNRLSPDFRCDGSLTHVGVKQQRCSK